MEIFSFSLASWPYLPADYDGPGYVTCPNELYDPARGHDLYREFIDLYEYAEELGFDGIAFDEHHAAPYCLQPSPNLMAAIAARVTSRAKLLILGNAIPLHHPLQVAEEYAMIDVISGGRLLAGLVVGDIPGYYVYNINPTEARGRFAEALDLIVKAWSTRGPFEFHGEFFRTKFVNPWPRPLQQPHPPVWIPGIASLETMELCAKNNFTYTCLPFFRASFADTGYALFRKTWLEAGRDPDPSKLGLTYAIYVAETDAKARAEYEEHFWYMFRRLLTGSQVNGPGYMSEQAVLRMMGALDHFAISIKTFEEILEGGFAVVGSPSTVAQKLAEMISATGAGNLLALLQVGSLPFELAKKNHQLFAEEVMPLIKKEFPKGPVWTEATVGV